MSNTEIKDRLSERGVVAIRVSSAELDGFFQKRYDVPFDAVAWVTSASASPRLARAGEKLSGEFSAVVVKTGTIALSFRVSGLRSSDGFGCEASLEALVALDASANGPVLEFVNGIPASAKNVLSDDVRSRLEVGMQRALASLAKRNAMEKLLRPGELGDLNEEIGAALEGELFRHGLGWKGLAALPAFTSIDFQERVELERKEEAEVRKQEDVLLRQQQQKEKVQQIADKLKDGNIQAVIAQVQDPKLRDMLVLKLVDQDLQGLSPGELAEAVGKWGDELVNTVGRFFTSLAPEDQDTKDDLPAEKAEEVYLAAGNLAISFDPADPSKPKREIRFEESLRSVRVQETPSGRAVLAGTKRGIFIADPAGGSQPRFYPFPSDVKPRGGANASAIQGKWLFATHSEFGIARWDVERPGQPGALLYHEMTREARTVRAVMPGGDGLVYFAAGNGVFRLDPADPGPAPTPLLPASRLPVTGLAVGKDNLYASTGSDDRFPRKEGAILVWRKNEPMKGREVVRRNDPILALHLAKIGSIPFLLYATKDHCVQSRVIGQNLEWPYEAGAYSVTLVAAASDLICGIDRSGRYLLFWKAANRNRPDVVVDVGRFTPHEVYDLFLVSQPL